MTTTQQQVYWTTGRKEDSAQAGCVHDLDVTPLQSSEWYANAHACHRYGSGDTTLVTHASLLAVCTTCQKLPSSPLACLPSKSSTKRETQQTP
jgi:hypothetical protein